MKAASCRLAGPPEVILAWHSRWPRARPAARPRPLIYNALVLALAHACMTATIWLFFVGITGSLVVVIISFFEDLMEVVGKD